MYCSGWMCLEKWQTWLMNLFFTWLNLTSVNLKVTTAKARLSMTCLFLHRCAQGDVVTHTAWLNRSSILYAGEDKWSIDPRVSLVTLNQEEFTIKIENVEMTDEGQYVCAVQTSSRPKTTSVHILVQGNDPKMHRAAVMLHLCSIVFWTVISCVYSRIKRFMIPSLSFTSHLHVLRSQYCP